MSVTDINTRVTKRGYYERQLYKLMQKNLFVPNELRLNEPQVGNAEP